MWIFPKTFGKAPFDIPFWMVEKQLCPFFGKVIFRQSGTHRIFRKWKNTPTYPGGNPVEKVSIPHFT